MSVEINFPDRNLALELVRVTETAAVAASAWVGRGNKEAADDAASCGNLISTCACAGRCAISSACAPRFHQRFSV